MPAASGIPQVKIHPQLHPRLKAKAALDDVFLQDMINDKLWELVGGKPDGITPLAASSVETKERHHTSAAATLSPSLPD